MTQNEMTETEARTFTAGYSVANAAAVLAQSECKCEPYVDIFTFRRWKAQGMQVQRGSKAKKIVVFRPIMGQDESGNDVVVRKIPRTSSVFCRCQVAPIEVQTESE